jgi:predicted transcriptional regulator
LNEKEMINIMLAILEAANQGSDNGDDNEKKMTTTITNTMYTALFNQPELKEYWDVLIQKGLLSFDPNTGRFNTTAEGRIFLRAYNDMDYDEMRERTTKPTLKRQKQQRTDLLQ